VPYFGVVAAFLGVPTVALLMRSLQPIEGGDRAALVEAVSGQFREYFAYSFMISVVSAATGAVIGTMLALAVTRIDRPRWLRRVVSGFAGVAANLGGIPLAFAFIALLGVQGLLTRILFHWGVDLYGAGFRISDTWGILVVYLYFQIPLMLLVMLPAIDGLKPTWREAAINAGASRGQYWRHVGLPLLAPSLIGGTLLLFANAFSAYATASALSSKASKLVPLQIRFFLQGDTITGRGNLGYALSLWMVATLALVIGGYLMLRRRAERWRGA
jgi:putative spermidine/putrescine transport system permease protein